MEEDEYGLLTCWEVRVAPQYNCKLCKRQEGERVIHDSDCYKKVCKDYLLGVSDIVKVSGGGIVSPLNNVSICLNCFNQKFDLPENLDIRLFLFTRTRISCCKKLPPIRNAKRAPQ